MLTLFLFLDSRKQGGIETHVLTLARGMSRQPGYRVAVLLWRRYGDHPLVDALTKEGIPVIDLKGSFFHLYSRLKRAPMAVLHTHGYKANILGRLAAMMAGVQCVTTFHNGDEGSGRLRFYTLLDVWSARFSRNIAVSGEIAERLDGACHLIPNFVSMPEATEKVTPRSIAFVGRLEPEKRPDRFVALAPLFPNTRFELFGDGSLRAGLEQDAPENVHFMGFKKDLATSWPSIDALVICSDYEGLPMAALEAMAIGVPVLSLRVGDLPKLIQHGQNGMLSESPYSLRDVLATWLGLSESEKEIMCRNARLTIEREYSLELGIQRLRGLYERPSFSCVSTGLSS